MLFVLASHARGIQRGSQVERETVAYGLPFKYRKRTKNVKASMQCTPRPRRVNLAQSTFFLQCARYTCPEVSARAFPSVYLPSRRTLI